jgi:hypothetical protein
MGRKSKYTIEFRCELCNKKPIEKLQGNWLVFPGTCECGGIWKVVGGE